ncbi:MAG TPA: TonB-dependent receptor [Dyella sp.]|uniref:TonB-dependent receptor plug domain-containing protein n=1 Tax=Dyella sp. TaxID=1869338 RepID=UPI002D76F704|nr:TonB-dependent receptor [Dyella sp.]HET6552839.1 TonB-dependent receptor [Dyella sp.]
MKQKTLLATAIAAALVLQTWSVAAQDAAPAAQADQTKAKSLETVTVTGSRIRSVDVETSQPIFTMDRAAIQATGLTNVNDILARMPSMGTPDITPQDTLSSGADVGGRYVNVRNLGSQRTLVLVNGKRWSTSLSGLTDVSTIPVSMIDRIDILKDGASSIYGSDAIGGVVNIITKDKFDGAEANVYYGQNGKGDGQTQNYDFTWGHSTEKNSIIIGAAWQQTDPMWDNKRDETRYANGARHPEDGWSSTAPYGRIVDPSAPGTAGAGSYNSAGKWVPNQYAYNHGSQTTTAGAPAGYHLYNGSDNADRYNSTQDMTFRAGTKLKTLFVQDQYKLTDNITLHGMAAASVRDSSTQLAGYPFSTGNTVGDLFPTGVQISGQNAYNPFPGQDVSFFRRTAEMPRVTDTHSKVYNFNFGAQGYFQFLDHEWSWDADYSYSQNKIHLATTGNLDLRHAQAALGPTTMIDGQVACANAADRADGCQPWNILAGPGATSQALWNYLNYNESARQVSSTDDYTANVSGGLFEMPGNAGTVNLAVGIEHRGVKGAFRPDSYVAQGYTTDLAANATSGAYFTNEAYAELDVPVLRDLPGAQELGFNVASRYSHYSNFGSTTNNKYSFRWRPIEDVLVRGTFAKGFRAPTIDDLYGGPGQSFETFLDPCDTQFGAAASNSGVRAACSAAGVPANYRQVDGSGTPIKNNTGTQTPVPFISGSNPNLQPETSTTRTLGLVYSPHQVEGLDFTLDYYNIYVKNLITAVDASQILNLCYVQNDPSYCGRFTRATQADPSTGLAVGSVNNLNESLANLGTLKTEGYDVGIHYRLPETSFGRFRIASDSTYLTKYETVSGPGATPQDMVGFFANGQDAIYRLRSNLQVDWDYKEFGASWTVRYYSGLKDQCYDNTPGAYVECSSPNYTNPWWGTYGMSQKGSVAFNDAQFRYTAPWKGVFTVGVNNIFNKKGPYYYSVPTSGTGSPPYNPAFDIDRYFYVSYNQKF